MYTSVCVCGIGSPCVMLYCVCRLYILSDIKRFAIFPIRHATSNEGREGYEGSQEGGSTSPAHGHGGDESQEAQVGQVDEVHQARKGVERKPLLRKSEFTESCMTDLDKHGFNPPQLNFLPDGRWTVETRTNGGRLKFTAFHVSFG